MNTGRLYGREDGEVSPIRGLIRSAAEEQIWGLFAEIGAFHELF